MFDFAHPIYLLALLAIPLFVALYFLDQYRRRRALRRFGQPSVLAPLMPDASRYMPAVKLVICMLAMAAVALILARPRAGKPIPQQARMQGIEIMIAFDVSNSMLASATDNPEGISRLDQARLLLDKLVDKLSNDKVGLEVFAADTKVLMPLTTDYYTVKMYLNELSPSMVTYQGTNLSDAIVKAQSTFSTNDSIHKAIILITDAESHDGDAVAAAAAALRSGIQVNVVGVGTSKGMPIPLGDDEYLTDDESKTVLTSFDADAAKKIAEAGKGVYVSGSSAHALDDLMASLDNLDKSEFQTKRYTSRDEQFPTFAWLALVLLVGESFLVDRKIGWLKRINFFTNRLGSSKKGAGILALILCFSLASCSGDGSTKGERKQLKQGNEHFEEQDFDLALDNYEKALVERPGSEAARFNRAATNFGLALSSPEDTTYLTKATKEYESLGESATDVSVRESAYYNRANIAFKLGRAADAQGQPGSKDGVPYYKESVEYYKKALKINPSNMRARENLLVALLQIPPEDQGGDNQDQQDQQQQDQQQQQQQQQQQEQEQQQNQLNQNTEQLLEAMQNKEDNTRRKMQMTNGQRNSSKPW